ncbi:SRPBCC family protein [Neolewinella antarctica]|uniref:SRPBCC family protein n=1 Tax=Neolewinella antarctica TaxID=442734 RepID=A0ABX0X914_9BACT|nr:hypothetical protein [Neolewinella antarctica]NJC25672.1 hypothetical protein [Neolewinella antarctica]
MPAASYRTVVNAPADHLWSLLLDKITRPDKYISGVTNVRIDEVIDERTLVRSMELGNGLTLKELITADPKTKTIVFKAIEEKRFTALVVNTVYEQAGVCYLEYTMSNIPLGDHAPVIGNMDGLIKASVLEMRGVAEAG